MVGILRDHYGSLHFTIPIILKANWYEIYTQTISTLKPRVLIQGDPECLQIPQNVNRIRSLLLAGIRAAMLWYQMGGSRWRLLFFYRRILTTTHKLLEG